MDGSDLLIAVRSLIRNKGFALASSFTLALGIAATTTIFSVVYGVLLRPLPYADPAALVVIEGEKAFSTGSRVLNFSAPEVEEFDAATRVFTSFAGVAGTAYTMRDVAGPVSIPAAVVSRDFFATLGAAPLFGGTFADTTQPQIVISERLWRRQFGAATDVIGRAVSLVDRTFTERSYVVVGVMPSEFQFPRPTTQAWLPLGFVRSSGDKQVLNRNAAAYFFIARRQPGASIADAQRDAARANESVAPHFNVFRRDMRTRVTTLDQYTRGRIGPALWILFGAVGLVLLVACANVANLMLARQSSRSREIAVRLALGAPRGRLLIFLLAEGLVIALVALAVGVGATFGSVRVLQWLRPSSLPRIDAVQVDLPILAFAAGVALLAAVMAGLGPALAAMRDDAARAFKAGSRAAGNAGARRMRSVLVIAEVAASIVLLVGAMLLARSLVALVNTDLGVNTDNVMTAFLDLGPGRPVSPARQVEMAETLRQRVAALASVQAVGLGAGLPPNNEYVRINLTLPDPAGGGVTSHMVTVVPASAGFFEALRIPLLAGRLFADGDSAVGSRTAIVDREAARRFFGNGDPIGRIIPISDDSITVIGVVDNVRYTGIAGPREGTIYRPFNQSPMRLVILVARIAGHPGQAAKDMTQIIRSYDSDIRIVSVQPLTEWVSQAVAEPRSRAWFMSAIAIVALLLAVIGLYSVVAYTTLQRTAEIGVRMALGARSGDVIRMVVQEGATLALTGTALGIAAAYFATGALAAFIHGVTTTDPFSFGAAGATLVVVAMAASYIPARRAARVDPAIALRTE